MCNRNRPYEAQSKPEAPFSTTLIASIQPFPDVREVVSCDADARVRDIDAHDSPVSTGLDLDSTAGRRVLDGVVHQVRQSLAKTFGIGRTVYRVNGVSSESGALAAGAYRQPDAVRAPFKFDYE